MSRATSRRRRRLLISSKPSFIGETTRLDGQSKIDGFTDDFAFLIQGLIDLYEASFGTRWLDLAGTLQKRLKQWWTDGLDISA